MCKIPGCMRLGQRGRGGKRSFIKGYCQKHYKSLYMNGDPLAAKDIVLGENRIAHPLWRTYTNMKQRCYNTGCCDYDLCGAMGVRVCERWLGPEGFSNFVKDVGEKPKGKSLFRWPDRYGDYAPENVRWSTAKLLTSVKTQE